MTYFWRRKEACHKYRARDAPSSQVGMQHTGAYTRASPPPLEIPCTLRRAFRDVAADDVTDVTPRTTLSICDRPLPAFAIDVVVLVYNITFCALVVHLLL